MTTPHSDPNFPPHPLDGALKTYFRKQVPNPWPACRALDAGPRPVLPARPRPATGISARVVLAIAAALLLGVGIFLSSGFPNAKPIGPNADPGLNGVTADGSNLLPPPKKPGPMGDTDLPLN